MSEEVILSLLAVFLLLVIPVCAVTALVIAIRLKERVRMLERRLAETITVAGAAATAQAEATPEIGAREAAPSPAPEASPAPVARTSVPPVAKPSAQEALAFPSSPPSPARDIEEQLGTRWAVWIGGLALALGGLFLVRISIEQGLLGPTARVSLGGLFALLLAGAGEWMRRRETALSLGGFSSAHIPRVLSGSELSRRWEASSSPIGA